MRIMVVLLIAFLIAVGSNIALADNQITQIKEALIRWLCYEVYWSAGTPSTSILEKTLPFEIKTEADKFYVWVNDLDVTESHHMAGFYWGRIKNGEGAIIMREAYNINLIPPLPSHQKNRRYFESGDVVKDNLTMPADCTPRYDPMTAQKELILNTIISSMKKTFSRWMQTGIATYPHEITLVISDFNIDYPWVFVLVEDNNKLYRVTLHDPQDYDKIEDEYLFDEEYNKSNELLTKIRKHGIIRKITLDP